MGDLSVFPVSTELVLGPGMKDSCMPGYPSNTYSPGLNSAFAVRAVREVIFSDDVCIGGFRAFDFSDNASFWLLEAPKRTDHRLSALRQTTEDTFVLFGGDECHGIAQLRPSAFRPLPGAVPASVLGRNTSPGTCICE